jgi:hypothetical protein
MPIDATSLIDRYCAAWSEPEPARRAELLASVWAADATVTDPTIHVAGAAGLLAHIGDMRSKLRGIRVVRTTRLDHHHNYARFGWRAIESGGNALPEGLDVVAFTADGSKIESVIGFFGPLKHRDD